jgi:hypothetical protein
MADDPYAGFDDVTPGRKPAGRSKTIGGNDPYAGFEDVTSGDPTEKSGLADFAYQAAGPGFNKGLADLIDLPGNLVAGAGRVVGVDLGQPSSALTRWLRSGPEPETQAGRWGQAIGEVGGGSALPLAGALTAANRVRTAAPTVEQLTQTVPRMFRETGEAIAANPGKVIAGEAVSTVGAGTGLAAAREAELGPMGQAFATMAGGFAPHMALQMSPMVRAGEAAKDVAARVIPPDVADAIAPPGTTNPLRQRAADTIRNMTSEQEARAAEASRRMIDAELQAADPNVVAEAQAIERAVPGLQLTPGERTLQPGLIDAQRQASRELPPDLMAQETARRAQNQQAIEAATDAARPGGPRPTPQQEPEYIVDTATRGIERQRLEPRANQAQADANEQALVGQIEGGIRNRAEVGAEVRDALTQARQQTRERMRGLADAAGLNNPAGIVDVRGLRDDLQAAYRGSNALRNADGSAATAEHPIVDTVGRLADTQNVNGLTQIRSEIADELQAAIRNPTPGNAGQRRGLAAMLQRVDQFLDDAGQAIGDPNLALRYRQFRQQYRQEYIERFERGPVYRVLKNGQHGYQTADEQVASAFFDAANPAAARQYTQIFGETPAIRSAALDSLYGTAVLNGQFNERAFQVWMRRNREVLQNFPQLRQELGGIEQAAAAIGQQRAAAAARLQEIDTSLVNRELSRIAGGTATAEDVIQRAMTSPARMAALMRAMPNSATRTGVWRAVFDRVMQQGDPLRFIQENREAIRAALPEGTIQNMVQVLRAMERTRLVDMPQAKRPSAQPGIEQTETALNMGLNQLSSRIFAYQSGRTSARYVATDVLGRVMRGYSQRQANRLLMQAMLDPNVGRAVREAAGKPYSPPAAKKLRLFLIASGNGPDEPTQPEEQDQMQDERVPIRRAGPAPPPPQYRNELLNDVPRAPQKNALIPN